MEQQEHHSEPQPGSSWTDMSDLPTPDSTPDLTPSTSRSTLRSGIRALTASYHTPRTSVESAASISTRDSDQIVEVLRRYQRQSGFRPGTDAVSKLTQAEYQKLFSIIRKLPCGDPVRGLWNDKLRYDYDGEYFRIRMPRSVHERFIVAVRDQINDYIDNVRKTSENNSVKEFASGIHDVNSSSVYYHRERHALEPDVPELLHELTSEGHKIDLRARDSVDYTYSSASYVEPDPESEGPNDPEARGKTISPKSESSTSTHHYDPDGCWQFIYGDIKDKNSCVVLEVSEKQNELDLRKKTESLIEDCGAKVVIACYVYNEHHDAARMELWRPTFDDKGNFMGAIPVKTVRLLAENGTLKANLSSESLYIELDDFASEPSLMKFFQMCGNKEVKKYPPLYFDLESLGRKLRQLRADAKPNEEEFVSRPSRKRPWDYDEEQRDALQEEFGEDRKNKIRCIPRSA